MNYIMMSDGGLDEDSEAEDKLQISFSGKTVCAEPCWGTVLHPAG